MRFIVSVSLAALLAFPVAASVAQAGADTVQVAGCAPRAGVRAPFGRCALWLEGGELRRGSPGEILGVEDALKPVALSRYVTGDSAIVHARAYERDTRQSLWVRFAAGAFMLTGSVMAVTGRHDGSPYDYQRITVRQGGLVLGGMALDLLSYPLRWRGGGNEGARLAQSGAVEIE
jgi:hypothetical protein